MTDPQVWHSPHRPTHLDVVQPHSVQRNAGRAVREEVVVDTAVTLTAATHTPDRAPPRPRRPPRPAGARRDRPGRAVTASQRPRRAHRARRVTPAP
ncbi:hypothetical protein Cpa01nite_28540 [Cellulomonas pakistanensis]|uniref:Uncharacterized protein n=1 Tax=Cellulomonas pakistanensis TaxID=992287 RepID=A0A919PCZ2_9CELL|nr:hypothetical protein Cpa01nite_28540 [Cellulomonas pakistanensis]